MKTRLRLACGFAAATLASSPFSLAAEKSPPPQFSGPRVQEAKIEFVPADAPEAAEVRLLGPASMPLSSVYPKMAPILMLAALFAGVSGLLILLMPYAAPSTRMPRPSPRPPLPEHMWIA